MLTESFWEKYFEVYDLLNIVIPYKNFLNIIFSALDIQHGDMVLDAGSGTGNLSVLLSKVSKNIISLDYSDSAKKVHLKKEPLAEIKKADLTQKLPFPDEYFDKIACILTLHTIPRGSRMFLVNEFYRVLKKNGRIILANPSSEFKPGKIYLAHLKADFRLRGFVIIVKDSLKLIVPTVRMFYYNYLIHTHTKEKDGGMLELNEQFDMLQAAGFREITATKLIYAETTACNVATK